MSSKFKIVLKMLAIVAMGLTSLLTLLGGVGTACIAWNADMYGGRFAVFVPTMPLYQVFVYICLLVGIVGSVVTYALLRGDKWAYKGALITLSVGLIAALAQMIHSSWLREVAFTDTMPTAMRFYITVLTLILFLLLKLPGIRNRFDVDFTKPWPGKGSKSGGGGLTACIGGLATISCPIWAGASHMLEGYNLVNVLKMPLMVGGGLMILAGVILLVPVLLETSHKQVLRSIQHKLRNTIRFTTNTN